MGSVYRNSVVELGADILFAKDLAKVMSDIYKEGDEVLKQETLFLTKDIIKEGLK